jgi:chitinase
MRWLQSAAVVTGTLAAFGCSTTETKTEEVAASRSQALTLPTHVVEGYWHNFYNSSVCPMRLTQAASYFDVLHVSFADNAGSGNVAFNLYTPKAGEPCAALDAATFKADIQTLKSQNKAVILSLGGADGAISMGSSTEQTNFVNSMKSIFSTWGFSGIDIDLESGSGFTHGSQIQSLLPGAIQTLSSWYSTQGSPLGGHMFLTMAPEHPYVQGGDVAYSGIWGAYLPMINTLRSQLDILHVQLYNNSSVTTPNVAPYNGQNFPVDSVDNLVASVKMLIEGFDTAGGPHFNGLNANQVAFGVPSGPKSSNPPFISTTTINNAFDCVTSNTHCQTLHMNANQPNFRGVMTWSVNWDAYDVAKNTSGRVDFDNIKKHMNGTGSCTPSTSCSAKGATCGSIFDGCNTVSCGTCSAGNTCNSSNQCVASCTPKTCAQLSASCGSPSDGCGGTLNCGSCPNGGDNCTSNFVCVGELKSSWTMDSFWGTNGLLDATANNNTATTSGGVTNVTGKINNAMQFDGTSGYATVPASIHNLLTGQSGASVTAWIKNDGPRTGCSGTNCIQGIYFGYATGTNGASTSRGGLGLRINENYELSCGGRSTMNDSYQDLKYSYSLKGQWAFVACVLDAANKKITLYVNGTAVTNMTASFGASTMVNSSNTNVDYIGGYPAPGTTTPVYFWNGAIDQLKMHNKVLSTSEITTLYQEGGGTSCTPKSSCSVGAVCGTQPNGCGGLVTCGSCTGGQTCTSSNTCVSTCTPKTCSNAGVTGGAVQCGTPSDGCGGQLSCGTCTSPNVCNASFQCVAACTPTTCAAAGKNCGTMSDGCSATLNCGICSAGNTCTNNVCTAASGGGCAGLQEWSASEPWTNYASSAPYSQRTHNGHKWQCFSSGFCYYEPGTTNGNYGWTDLGGC